jgi:hypothetical protein
VQSKSEKVHLNFEKLREANILTEIISCQTSNIPFSKSKISKMKIQIQAFELQISFCVGQGVKVRHNLRHCENSG